MECGKCGVVKILETHIDVTERERDAFKDQLGVEVMAKVAAQVRVKDLEDRINWVLSLNGMFDNAPIARINVRPRLAGCGKRCDDCDECEEDCNQIHD